MENPQLLDLILHGVAALLPGLFMAAAGLVRGGVLLTGLIVGLDPLWIGWPESWGSELNIPSILEASLGRGAWLTRGFRFFSPDGFLPPRDKVRNVE